MRPKVTGFRARVSPLPVDSTYGDGSDPDIACRECAWEGMRDALSGA